MREACHRTLHTSRYAAVLLAGHAEVVRVTYDIGKLKLTDVLEIFWAIHDPTTPNQQGNDKGTQYRSAIYYSDPSQQAIVEESVEKAQKLWDSPIVTELKQSVEFYPAEAYHRNYFKTHPEQAYCQVIINPKLQKLKEKFASRIKE